MATPKECFRSVLPQIGPLCEVLDVIRVQLNSLSWHILCQIKVDSGAARGCEY